MNINELMNKPLWQMTGEEFLAIINEKKPAESAPAPTDREINPSKYYVYGLAGIARLFGCSIPTANRIKKSGVIDKAITQWKYGKGSQHLRTDARLLAGE